MNPNQQNHASVPFWDFIQSLDPNQGPGRGVDHNTPQFFGGPGFAAFGGPGGPGGPAGPAGPPPPPPSGPHGAGFEWGPWFHGGPGGFGGPGGPWGHPGRRGGHHHGHGRFRRNGMNPGETRDEEGFTSMSDLEREADPEKAESPDTMRADAPDPAEVAPEDNTDELPHRPRGCGHGRRGGGRCGRGGPWGHHARGFGHHGGPGHHAPPPYPGAAPFDFGGFLRGWANHPFFRNLREQAQRFQPTQTDNDSFTPPVDIFNTERAFILHVALPGAKKEDIGVNWDADSSVLNIAGVVHRPGDEEFLSTLTSGERKVGLFERNVTLPPEGSGQRDEVDGLAISAKMEDGVLVVTVPKLEKEWTEIHKVDIE